MGRIPEDKIQEVRDRADIVEVVSSYLPLKRSGVNHQGLCPFHQEKTPSFNVNASRQIFHCFGCGVGGNVVTFVMKMEGLAFPEAVRRLGERYGVEIADEEVSPAEVRRREERERLYGINDRACAFYHQVLLEDEAGAPGRRYLRQRGYEGETVRAFQLGYAPEAWEALAGHLKQKGCRDEDVRKAGLVREGKQGRGDYDLFRNRLLFPIHDTQGRVVAFGGRVLDDSLPKYINSPETEIYHKGRTLYGLFQARDAMRHTGEALVVEGYFDVLALHRAGFAGAVAACGTALTAEHAQLLKRYADRVLLVFDEDAAGRQATFRAMDALLPSGLEIAVVALPAGEDPDSLIRASGEEGFRDCLANARPVLEVFLEDQLRSQGESVEGRARAAEQVLERIRRLPGDLERDLYLKRLAERTGIDAGLLRGKARAGGGTAQPGPRVPRPEPHATVRRPLLDGAVARAQKFLLRLMLADDRQRAQVRAEGTAGLFQDAEFRELAEYLLASEDSDGRLPEDLMSPTLSESQQSLLAQLMLQEDAGWADNPDRILVDCRRAVHHAGLRARLEELGRCEEAARREGDEAALAACLEERIAINREMKKKL